MNEEGLDQWLASARSDLIGDLAAALDLDAGLRDALLPSRRADLTDDLRVVLDLDAGLAAITPSAIQLPVDQPRHFPPAASATQSVSDISESATASLIRSLPPARRLALREDPAIAGIALVFRLAHQTARARDLTRTRDHATVRALDQALANDCDLARDLARAINRALLHAIDRGLARARALARALDLAHVLARNLDLDLLFARNLDLAHARDLARDLAHDLAHALDLARDLTVDPDLTRAFNRDIGLAHDHDFGLVFGRACNDFSEADLRDVDLTGMPLTGVRWSRATQWPPAWEEQIDERSEEIEPGLFEIRDGTTHADTSTILVDL